MSVSAVSALAPAKTLIRNLMGAMYKMSVKETPGSVLCLSALDDHLFVSLDNHGLFMYRVEKGELNLIRKLESSNCYDVLVSSQHLVYILEEETSGGSRVSVCIHQMANILSPKTETVAEPAKIISVLRRAPIALHSSLGLLAIGGKAWVTSWTTTKSTNREEIKEAKDMDESHVAILEIDTGNVVTHWKAVSNSVFLLRAQTYGGHKMVGVADSRTGLRVYDLACRSGIEYVCLYCVPVEEIRNFRLIGDDLAVFHKFEPNVSFWNMREQRTILCINIQDQMKEMTQEFLEADDEDDSGLVNDDGDHVTSVTSLVFLDEMMIVYGTMSGCIFGMSVARRSKVFNIPSPFPDETGCKNVLGIAFLPGGKLVIGYEKHGLILMDFGYENPPPRPPTRCQKRTS